MEFLHDGRPKGKPRKKDLQASEFLPPSASNPNHWTGSDRVRFDAADKLIGHLSRGRTSRQHANPEWGGPEDRITLVRKISAFIAAQPHASRWFPETVAVLESMHGGARNA